MKRGRASRLPSLAVSASFAPPCDALLLVCGHPQLTVWYGTTGAGGIMFSDVEGVRQNADYVGMCADCAAKPLDDVLFSTARRTPEAKA